MVKIFKKQKEAEGEEEIKERMQDIKEAITEIPEGYKEFDEILKYYKEEEEKLKEALEDLRAGPPKKKPVRGKKALDLDDDEAPPRPKE